MKLNVPSSTACSPPDGSDCRDADGGRLAVVESADSGLEELLDELRRHGCCEATSCPQCPTKEEGGRRWLNTTMKRVFHLFLFKQNNIPKLLSGDIRCFEKNRSPVT